MAANESVIVHDTTSSAVTVKGNWAEQASLPPGSSPDAKFLGPFFLSDDDSQKGSLAVIFLVRVFAPGTYRIFLLHPAGILSATRVPVHVTADNAETSTTFVDQRMQTNASVFEGVGGTLVATIVVERFVNITVSNYRTHLDSDNFFANFVYVDGAVVEAVEIIPQCSPCSTICTSQEFVSAPCTPTLDRVCRNVSTCQFDEGFYESLPFTLSSDTQCSPISNCSTSQYIAVPSTRNSDVTCLNVSFCDLSETFQAAPATETSDTLCLDFCHPCSPDTETTYPCDDIGQSGTLRVNAVSEELYSIDHNSPQPPLEAITDVSFSKTGQWQVITQGGQTYLSDGDTTEHFSIEIRIQPRRGLYRVGFSYLPGPSSAVTVPVSFTYSNGLFKQLVDQTSIPKGGFFTLGDFFFDDFGAIFLLENTDTTSNPLGNTVTFREIQLQALKLPVKCDICPTVVCEPNQYIWAECVCVIATSCTEVEFEIKSLTTTSDRHCQELTVCNSDQFEQAPPTKTTDRSCARILPGCHDLTIQTAPPTSTSDRQCESLCNVCPEHFFLTHPCDLFLDPNDPNVTLIVDVQDKRLQKIGDWEVIPHDGEEFTSYLSDQDQLKGSLLINTTVLLEGGIYDISLAYISTVFSAVNVPVTVKTIQGNTIANIDQTIDPESGWYFLGEFQTVSDIPISIILENRGTNENVLGNTVTFAGLKFVSIHKQRSCKACTECGPGFLIDADCTQTTDTTCKGMF